MSKKQERSAVATPHNYSITTKGKSHAEALFDMIGTGKENAVRVSHRNNNNTVAREFRQLVADANKQDDAIINDGDGKGYYRPNMERPEEVDAARHYINSLLSKADKLEQTAYGIASKLGGRYMTL